MSYNNIFNPLTNEFVELNTSEGISVLKNYVSYVQNGGSKKPKSKRKSKSKGPKPKSKSNPATKKAETKAAAKEAAAQAAQAAQAAKEAAQAAAKAAAIAKALEERQDRLEIYNPQQQQQLLENGLPPQPISDENDIDFFESGEEQDS